MRKLVVLLAFVITVTIMTAALPGCGSPAATEQNVAPTNTEPLLQEAVPTAPYPSDPSPTPSPVPEEQDATLTGTLVAPKLAGNSPHNAANATPSPSPVPTADDALEFVPTDSRASAGRDGGITEVGQEASQKRSPPTGPVQGPAYTWEDGDRTLTAYLQTDLVVDKGSDGLPRDIVEADDGGSNIVRSADAQSEGDTLPVFRSESGSLMTLPGGILLVLSAKWSQAETDAFFSDNDVKMDRVSELSYVANGFFIETEPGFPSLELANELADLDGVEVSSPNWGREAVPK